MVEIDLIDIAISVLITVILFLFKDSWDRRRERRGFGHAIIDTIKLHQKTIDENKEKLYLDVEIFQSLFSSSLITYFKESLSMIIQYYNPVRKYNDTKIDERSTSFDSVRKNIKEIGNVLEMTIREELRPFYKKKLKKIKSKSNRRNNW